MKAMYRILMTALVLLALSAVPALAQEDPEDVSAFSNPTQATIAEGLAATATEQNMEAINELENEIASLENSIGELAANFGLTEVTVADLEAQLPDLEAQLATLDTALPEYQNLSSLVNSLHDLEDAKEALDLADVTEADIAAMRAKDMGWGEIAHALGVHPSTIGQSVANANRHKNNVGEEAGLTARNKATGKSSGAVGASAGSSNSGGSGKGNGNAGGSGNAGGNGNAGGDGDGNGNGNGKGGGNAGGNGKGGGKK